MQQGKKYCVAGSWLLKFIVWSVVVCLLVGIYNYFRGTSCFDHD